MKKIVFSLFSAALLIESSGARQTPEVDPYAETPVDAKTHGMQLISVRPSELNVLSANHAEISPDLRINVANFMFLWVFSSAGGKNVIEWKVEVPENGEYGVAALLEAKDCEISVVANGSPALHRVREDKWNRVSLGTVTLLEGGNRLRLEVASQHPVKLSSIEIIRPQIRERLIEEATSMRRSPEWFKQAGYGLMFQWTNRATPPSGPIKEWNQKVDDFDLDSVIDLAEESGASFVVWSIAWGQQFISAPIESLDRILPGRTTQRDLLAEMADRLHEKGIRLIFYYHYGYDCYHSKDPEWMRASGGYLPDKSKFFGNVKSILTEVGHRYGKKLDGWFFDGGQRYYNTHFDGSRPLGIPSAPFKELSMAARTGNNDRILGYNSWILPRLTEYQDYFAGEGQISHDRLNQGVFVDGGQKGLMAFGCLPLERRWGHIERDTPIPQPKFAVPILVRRITHATTNRYPIALNLEMYEDGSVSPASAKLLREVRGKLEKVRAESGRRGIQPPPPTPPAIPVRSKALLVR